MTKRLLKDAGRVLALYAICVLICLFAVPFVSTVFEEVAFYQWSVTVVFSGIIMLVMWVEVRSIGQKHAHLESLARRRDIPVEEKHVYKWYGFAVGALVQAPAVLVWMVAVISKFCSPVVYQAAEIILRVWFITFLTAYNTFSSAVPYLFILCSLVYFGLCGAAYFSGLVQEEKQAVLIERNMEKIRQGQINEVRTSRKKKKNKSTK